MLFIHLCQETVRWTNRYVHAVLLALVLCLAWAESNAQQPESNAQQSESIEQQPESNAQQPETAIQSNRTRLPSPKKATIYSAVLPGLGQVYNKKYWKVPIIYGAGGAFIYFVSFWHNKYVKFRDAYEELYDQPNPEPIMIDGRLFNKDELERPRNGYRRYRDLCVLGFGAVYALNIIDAMVDANFFYYDISNDLSLHIQPAVINGPDASAAFGFGLQLGF